MEGNLHVKIDWASLIVGRKFTVFALQGCHLEPGARDFPWLLREWPPATFIGK